MSDEKTLVERMIDALADKPIDNRGDRLRAYSDAGVSLAGISDEEWRNADAMAHLHELSRRIAR